MRNPCIVFAALLTPFFSALAVSQTPTSPPPPGATVSNTTARSERYLESRMRDMRNLEERLRMQNEADKRIPDSPKLSSEMIDRIKKRRRVSPELVNRYAGFLQMERTGIFKVFPDANCVTATLVKIDGECKEFVAESSGFSFRNRGYSDRLFHDIYYDRGALRSFGFFSQGIIVAIGDTPIESVDLSNPGSAVLKNYNADLAPTAAMDNAKRFRSDVAADGFVLSDHIEPKVNTTYVFRHIAYRLANSIPPLNAETTFLERKFLSLAFDNRDDSIVAFRIAKVDEDGALTIVWKEMTKADAPKLKFPKGKFPRDIRDDRNEN